MPDVSRDQILQFAESELGKALPVEKQSDILRLTGTDGDDAVGFIAAFGKAFSVDLTGYEPAQHHFGEGWAVSLSWPFANPRIEHSKVPLSISLLHRAATEGRWPMTYPERRATAPAPWHLLNFPILLIGLGAACALTLELFHLIF